MQGPHPLQVHHHRRRQRLQELQVRRAHLHRQGRRPQGPQRAQEQGRPRQGDPRHQEAARRRQHEEDGLGQRAGYHRPALGQPVQLRPRLVQEHPGQGVQRPEHLLGSLLRHPRRPQLGQGRPGLVRRGRRPRRLPQHSQLQEHLRRRHRPLHPGRLGQDLQGGLRLRRLLHRAERPQLERPHRRLQLQARRQLHRPDHVRGRHPRLQVPLRHQEGLHLHRPVRLSPPPHRDARRGALTQPT